MTNCPENNPLQREGLSQFQRALAALHPSYVRVDERTIPDLLKLAAAYAKEAQPLFYQPNNPTPTHAWETLMDFEKQFQNPGDIVAEMKHRHDFSPHFALFLCFLKLFGYLQNDSNQLTQEHLKFYFTKVLQLSANKAVEDSVHVLFTLAQNATEQIIDAKTPLDAGRDASKPTPRPLTYTTHENLTVNRAKIIYLRSAYVDPATRKVHFAPAANTVDGIKKPLPPSNPAWNAFGPKMTPAATCPSCDGSAIPTSMGLPEAQIGFALASPILQMAEGTRTVIITIALTSPVSVIPNNLRFNVQLSGAKAWIEAGAVPVTITDTGLRLEVVLNAEEKEGIVNFNPTTLDGNYLTNAPVMRCWLTDSVHYTLLRSLRVNSIQVTVAVEGIKKSLILENDLGRLNSEKPFMPFGAQPEVGSILYVNCPEARQKTLESVTVRFEEWVGKPGNLTTHYQNYKTYKPIRHRNNRWMFSVDVRYSKQESEFKATVQVINGNLSGTSVRNRTLFSDFISSSGITIQPPVFTVAAGSFSGFGYLGGYLRKGNLFIDFTPNFAGIIPTVSAPPTLSDSLLKITLDSDFLHGIFPKILTEVVTFNGRFSSNKPVPNAPYTPVTAGLVMKYTAHTQMVTLTNTDFDSFSRRDLQFFHLGIFGHSEEHAFLKKELRFLGNSEQSTAHLLPQYVDHGTFYVGLQDIGPLESVSILFQVAEGSANPERPAAAVRWFVLVRNQWLRLTEEHIVSDTTNQLLRSGIIQFYLPENTASDNTLLESGLVWLKAELWIDNLPAPVDSVCNLIALHPQAVLATFADPDHYKQPLAAHTISKARVGVAAIKKIEQPYASFGGKPEEINEAFYQRVSERLRHKQRAVSIWDYEHLVLQEFPNVFKAKCLNHTRLDKAKPINDPGRLDQLAPGHVTMVLVPDLHNQNAVNKLEPKVDLNTLQLIDEYLQRHTGKLVAIETSNPEYEPVQLKFKVRFKRGYAFSIYKKELSRAIVRYLSPWAFDDSAEIPFGGTLEKSVIIDFIERLEYVDVLRDFVMLRRGDAYEGYEEITATNPMAVLVSCQEHCISDFTDC